MKELTKSSNLSFPKNRKQILSSRRSSMADNPITCNYPTTKISHYFRSCLSNSTIKRYQKVFNG